MRRNLRFIVSLVVIVLAGWADVHYIGAHENTHLPNIVKQGIHFIMLSLTWYIGYFNWKFYPEKWLSVLWTMVYVVFSCFLFVTAILEYLKPGLLNQYYTNAILNFRSVLSGVLPFLVFYLLYYSARSGKKH